MNAEMFVEKRNNFQNDVIFIDGLWGTGKSLLGPIVSTMSGVERVKIESSYEYVCWLYHLKKIDKDAAIWLLRTHADTTQYHNTIGREVNLRWSDDTGLKYVPNKLSETLKLFSREGDHKISEINTANIALCIMSHMLMLAPEILAEAFDNRLRVIEVVRHPLFMVEHFRAYLDRFDSPREFTLSFYKKDEKLPWFANEFEQDYLAANPTERAVLCIIHLYRRLVEQMAYARTKGLQVLEISFEQAVFGTEDVLARLESFTNRRHHPRIKSILRAQKLPRTGLNRGRGHLSYGWKETTESDSESVEALVHKVEQNVDKHIFGMFVELIRWYECSYPSKLHLSSSY